MRGRKSGLGHSYVLGLVAPALLLNLLAILALAAHDRRSGAEVVAEVEILGEGCEDRLRRERCYLVRLTRVLKGAPGSLVLRARFREELRPEGLGLASWSGPSFAAGERLFVVMARGRDCHYRVSHLWLGSAPSPRSTWPSRQPISAG